MDNLRWVSKLPQNFAVGLDTGQGEFEKDMHAYKQTKKAKSSLGITVLVA